MTWPNELQQLEEDLAAGRVSPDEYHRRRNELLSETGEPDAPPSTAAAADEPRATGPFPPAFRWETTPPQEATQVIQPVPRATGDADSSEDTQVVWTGHENDSERTQVVQAGPPPYQQMTPPGDHVRQGPANPYQPDPNQGNQGWGTFQGADPSAPPWANSELPPMADQQSAWMRQGPEMFEAPAQQSRAKQIIGIAVLAVVMLALVGAGFAYFLNQNQSNTGPTATPPPNQPQATTTSRELPAPPPPNPPPTDTSQALIDPPGQPRDGGGLLDLPRLQGSESPLPRSVVNALANAGMTDGVFKTTTRNRSTLAMFALTLPNEQAATAVVQAIATEQRNGGLPEDGDRALQGLLVFGTPDPGNTTYRATYVLYNRAIFIEVFGDDRDAVLANFDSLLDDQVAHAPPTVR